MDARPRPLHLVVAGYGYVGEPLARLLADHGHRVTALARSLPVRPRAPGIAIEACDISDARSLRALAARIAPVDRIVHCASASGNGRDGRERAYRSVYVDGCRHLLEAFAPRRLVLAASTSVYAQADGSTVDEDSPAEPPGATGKILREAEDLALAAGHVVARLAGIYGPGRSHLLRRFLAGMATVDEGGTGDCGRWINQIHRADAAEALALLALGELPQPPIVNVCDDTPMLQRAFFDRLAGLLGGDPPPLRPGDPGRTRGWSHKRVSNARLRGLGWVPSFPSYFDALANDSALIPSIQAQLAAARDEPA